MGLLGGELACAELGFYACDHLAVSCDLGGVVQGGDGVVSLHLKVLLLHLGEALFEIGRRELFDFFFCSSFLCGRLKITALG